MIKYVPNGLITKDGQFDTKVLKRLAIEQSKRYKAILKRYLES